MDCPETLRSGRFRDQAWGDAEDGKGELIHNAHESELILTFRSGWRAEENLHH
jgi:hypothetical protein